MVRLNSTIMVGLLCIIANNANAAATYIDSDKYADKIKFDNDVTVSNGATIDATNIYINNSITLVNRGNIRGDIHVCAGCDVYIQNNGTISGDLYLENHARVTQLIRDNTDITYINIGGDYNILVDNAVGIQLHKLMRTGVDAGTITINNSSIDLTPDIMMARAIATGPRIELIGDVVINIDDISNIDGAQILSNVTGNGRVKISTQNTDKLHTVQSNIHDGELYLYVVRETDYYKILNNDTGTFINIARSINPDDKLVAALDNAADMAQIHDIISRSGRINPIRMTRSIETINRFTRDLTRSENSNPHTGIAANELNIISDNLNAYGNMVTLNGAISPRINVGIDMHAGFMEYSDSLDDYYGIFYGGQIHAMYKSDIINIFGVAGLTLADLQTDGIFTGNNIDFTPRAAVAYSAMEIGMPILSGDQVNLIPFVGYDMNYSHIANSSEFQITPIAGVNFEYAPTAFDIQYKYRFRLTADAHSNIGAMVGASAWFDPDGAGIDISIGIQHMDFITAYSLTFGARIAF